VASLLPCILNESEQTSRVRFDLLSLVDPGFMTRVGVHYGLFFGAIRGQATMEQMSDLIQKGLLNLRGMYGCFAMTELGYVVPYHARLGMVRAVISCPRRPTLWLAYRHGHSHGSNVPGLETTATFDPATDEFIIHTPTLTATKWWIGGAAHSATHAYAGRRHACQHGQ